MKRFKFLVSLLFAGQFALFANTNTVNKIEINNIETTKQEAQVEVIEKSEDEIFQEESIKTVKKLLSKRKTKVYFVSKKDLYSYYKKFDYNLIWIDKDGVKDIALNLLETIKNDPVLKPHSKKAFKLEQMANSLNKLESSSDNYLNSLTKIDFMLTGIYNRYMHYLSTGFIDWKSFKRQLRLLDKKEEIIADWEKHNVRKNKKSLLFRAITQNDLKIAFNEVDYSYPHAKELSKTITEFEKIALDGGYTKVNFDKTIRLGEKHPSVKDLRKRLLESKDLVTNTCATDEIVEEPVAQADNKKAEQEEKEETTIITDGSDIIENECFQVYDEVVRDAVISFQKSHGLFADGVVGPTTKKYLNIPVEKKIVQMRLNLERMRWLPRTLGEKFLLVNIPEYKLKMYDNGEVKLNMNIVVGERKNPTPIFSNKMSFIVLNPYWRIPPRIAKREIIPKLVKNPGYLNGKGINIHENWDHNSTSFDVNSVDWTLYTDENQELYDLPTYRFIQVPSNKNPLGRMKFMFPNKYSVYLHDSPAKRYFKHTKRAYSHGCVRLAEPRKLLELIASDDVNLDYTKAKTILKDINKTQIGLDKKIPVHMVYLTSWVDEKGKVQFRDDVYRYDRMQKKLLYKKNQYM